MQVTTFIILYTQLNMFFHMLHSYSTFKISVVVSHIPIYDFLKITYFMFLVAYPYIFSF